MYFNICGQLLTEEQVLAYADYFHDLILETRRRGEHRLPNDFEFACFVTGNSILAERERLSKSMISAYQKPLR